MGKITLILMIITLFSKGLGFFRELVLSYYYGTTNISDIFIISSTIPNVVFGLIIGGISATLIPMYNRVVAEQGEKDAMDFTNKVIFYVGLISIIIIISCQFYMRDVVKIFALGFDDASLNLAVKFTRVTIISIIFIGFINIYTAFLQLNKFFIASALIGIPNSLVIIFFIILSEKLGVEYMAYGILLSSIIRLVFLLPSIKKTKYKFNLLINPKDKFLKEMLFMILPIILSLSANQINVVVDKTIASKLIVGGVATLSYSRLIVDFVQGIYVVSILSVIYPTISKLWNKKLVKEVEESFYNTFIIITIIIIPASIGIFIFSKEIIELIYNRGAFDSESVLNTSECLKYYSIGLIGTSLRVMISKYFYAINDTVTPAKSAIIAVVLNIILNIIFSKFLGIKGLALATSLSAIITTILLFKTFKKKSLLSENKIKDIFSFSLKICIFSFVMGFVAKIINYSLKEVRIDGGLNLLISIIMGSIVYFILLIIFRVKELEIITNEFKNIIRKK